MCYFLETWETKFEQSLLQTKIDYIREKHSGVTNRFVTCGVGHKIHEVQFDEDGEARFLTSYSNIHIPPEWHKFNSVGNGNLDDLLKSIRRMYETEINFDPRDSL